MEREDLGALFAAVARQLIDAERPLLAVHGLSMWGYITLSELARRPARTQLALARAIGYDKTRLIALLDELQGEGLITRRPDSADRRARVVRLTASGEQRLASARRDIRAMEAGVLEALSEDEQTALLATLPRLIQRPPSRQPGGSGT